MAVQALGNPLGNPLALPRTTASIGQILPFYNNPGPQWLPCDGNPRPSASYPLLASTLGGTALGRKVTRNANFGYDTTSIVGGDMTPDGTTFLTALSGTSLLRSSTDSGRTWAFLGISAPANSGNVLFLGNNTWAFYGTGDQVYYAVGLATWVSALTVTGYAGSEMAADQNGTVLFFMRDTATGTITRVYRSTNYGVSYTLAATITTNSLVRSSCFDNAGNWYFGLADGNIYKSSNAGSNWNLLTKPSGFSDVVRGLAAQGNTVVAAEGGTGSSHDVAISRDGGQTWTPLFSGLTLAQTANVRTNGRGAWSILATSGLIYVSIDNWNSFFTYQGSSTGSQTVIFFNTVGIYTVRSGATATFNASEYITSEFYTPFFTPQEAGAQYFIKAL